MAIDEEVVDVSQDWELACDVQQRFMHGADRDAGFAEYSARCRQLRALGGATVSTSCRLRKTA
jgi:hypothetical protein